MIYHDTEQALIDFVEAPFNDLNYLGSKLSKPNLIERLLFGTPVLQRFVSQASARNVVGNLIFEFLHEAKNQIETSEWRQFSSELSVAEECLIEVCQYLDVVQRRHANHGMAGSAEVGVFRAHNLVKAANYTADRVVESLGLKGDQRLMVISNRVLWVSYFLSEVYLLIGKKLVDIKFENKTIVVEAKPVLEKSLKGYWLSDFIEESSKLADEHTYMMVAKAFINNGRVPKYLAEEVVNNVLDKVFSINVRYVDDAMRNSPIYILLRDIVYFTTIVKIACDTKRMFVNRNWFFDEGRIRSVHLELIDSVLKRESNHLGPLESYIYVDKSDRYTRDNLAPKFGIRLLTNRVFKLRERKFGENNFKSEVGDFFEKKYIYRYLKQLEYYGFKVVRGFKAKTKAAVRGYDVDVVLHDKKRNQYYFIQVKFNWSIPPSYISERCRLFNDENFKKGYTRQLQSLRNNMSEPSIRQKLHSLNLSEANEENSHFVLLHNIPFLNFHEIDKVIFYEWNLFRNLIQDGKILIQSDHGLGDLHILPNVSLSDTEEVATSYMKNYASDLDLESSFRLFANSYYRVKIHGYNLEVKML